MSKLLDASQHQSPTFLRFSSYFQINPQVHYIKFKKHIQKLLEIMTP